MHNFSDFNFNTQERLFHCHWSPESQRYASGDALLTLLDRDWEISSVREECFSMSTGRYTVIHTFMLEKGLQRMTVPVVATPVVQRLACDVRGAAVPHKDSLPIRSRMRT